MATIEEVRALYQQGEWQKIKESVREEDCVLVVKEDQEKLLMLGWAHHQLGEYNDSIPMLKHLCWLELPTSIGESARRGLAHGLLQRDGDIEGADKIMQEIPPSLARDNVRMNMMVVAARKGAEIPTTEVMKTILNSLGAIPFATVNGHVVNNGCLALHEAREQPGVKPYLPLLPGLMETAFGIYEATGTAKNHLAGCLFRTALIMKAAGWTEGARTVIRQSEALWKELVQTQDGERYRQNLEGAGKLRKELES